MTALPAGTVTFLFTDIEGSTRLWEAHPEEMRLGLARHDELLRAAIANHRGHVFKTAGDAFFAAFPTAADALVAALEAQRALAAERWALPDGLRVRMALNTGVAEQRDGDYFGPPLNRAARLLAAGHGGQILVFGTTYELARDALSGDVALRNLGQHRLRDLERPEQIYQLVAPGLAADFPPLRSLDAFLHNLPVQLTSFIGRERELAELRLLLSTARLLTLTGIGGAGKTRLALQVAADQVEQFPEGVWLAEFAGLADSALVPQTVASALGLREQYGRAILPILIEFLWSRTVLLVMDNCEHMVAECARLADQVLRAGAEVRILATSQTPLGVPGEVAYGVPPLTLPDGAPASAPEQVSQFEAVRLFVERARLSKPGFAVTAENARAVAQVVHQLDGIPLAIELAAARTRVMSVQQIADRLEDRFRLLTGGGRTVAARHQTLKAAMDWSYELLASLERTLLRRLSVFAGGLTLEAAEAVCAGGDLDSTQILDVLAGLVDRSLAQVEETAGGATRYRLLETVRQYGRDRLREADEEEPTRTRHRDWYLLLAEEAERHLQGPEAPAWVDRLETEHDNLRAALEWSKAREADAEYWLRLAGALWRFWDMRGYWTEGRMWLDGALALSAGAATPSRVKVTVGAAYLASYQGDFERGVALAEESLALSERLGDTRGKVSCLNILGFDACRLEKYDRAAELGTESFALSQQVGDWWGALEAQGVLAIVARAKGDFGRASALLEELALRARQLGDKFRLAEALNYLGLVKREVGDYNRAQALLEESLALAQELKDKWATGFAQSNLGIVAWYQQDYPRAAELFAASLRLRVEVGEKRGIVTSLAGLGAVAAAQGQAERAAMLFACAEALRGAIGVPLPPFIRRAFDQLVADTRAALGDERFEEIQAKGRTMPLDAAVAYALEDSPPRTLS